MTLTNELKAKIIQAMQGARQRYNTAKKFAITLDISESQLSRVLGGETDRVLKDQNWISIARRLSVQLHDAPAWQTARTPVFEFIYGQLQLCQQSQLSGMFCDLADIGKTHAAKTYCAENKSAVFVDCSQVKTKQKLIRHIAKELGLSHAGKYAEVYEDMTFYMRTVGNVLVVLDEAGDLSYEAFLELKALWNATEGACGWYMMGADGLEAKIETFRGRKKVGYAEIFSRFGSRYQSVVPKGLDATEDFKKLQAALVGKVNGAGDVQKLFATSGGSLRRLKHELQKTKAV